jgi:hypothetical protein
VANKTDYAGNKWHFWTKFVENITIGHFFLRITLHITLFSF